MSKPSVNMAATFTQDFLSDKWAFEVGDFNSGGIYDSMEDAMRGYEEWAKDHE